MSSPFIEIDVATAVPRAEVPLHSPEALGDAIATEVARGARIVSYFAHPAGDALHLLAALLVPGAPARVALAGATVGQEYESLTPRIPALHVFERIIAEDWGVLPRHHPWLRPVRYTTPLPGRRALFTERPEEVRDFYRLAGADVHEVAVGPVHAGVIEPGHFRFQCLGERVHHLEIALGYQHRGIARGLVGGPGRRSLHQMEVAAGDTTIGHTTAYAEALEALCAVQVSERAATIRALALELERLANHTGDLGALAGDVGFAPTHAFCGRLRGDFLNGTALLCGSRFGRGLVVPGGVRFDLDDERAATLRERVVRAGAEVSQATALLWDSASVTARFEDTGVVDRTSCETLGIVGVAARAAGLARDTRAEVARGPYGRLSVEVATGTTGDVMDRARVRDLEVQGSVGLLNRLLDEGLPEGELRGAVPTLGAGRVVTTLSEGWRGEICHVALTDDDGLFEHYEVVDPSVHNWTALAMALRGEEISDFPLCNKSFNLSYCGHDL
jgi:Ni,Fe-hydrogenase III large subunit